MGITLCINCSGVHRALGVHLSKVRSLTLDSWDLETLSIMKRLGNSRVNAFLEFKLPANQKLESNAVPNVRNEFIKKKYVDRRWAADSADFCSSYEKLQMPNPQSSPADTDTESAQIHVEQYFFDNIKSANFPGILASIFAGVDPNVICKLF